MDQTNKAVRKHKWNISELYYLTYFFIVVAILWGVVCFIPFFLLYHTFLQNAIGKLKKYSKIAFTPSLYGDGKL